MIMIMKSKYVVVLHNTGNFGVEKVIGTFSTIDKAHDYVLEDSECQKDYLYHMYKLEEVELEEVEEVEKFSLPDILNEETDTGDVFGNVLHQADGLTEKQTDDSNSSSWRQSLANELHDLAYHIAYPHSDTTEVLQHAVTTLQGVVTWAKNKRDGKT